MYDQQIVMVLPFSLDNSDSVQSVLGTKEVDPSLPKHLNNIVLKINSYVLCASVM